jgi:two-component system OmpR family response regulator
MSDEKHILIVDDDDEILELLATTLSQYGFNTMKACNGTEMMSAILQQTPDLIILDLMMPGDNGLTLCKNLKGQYPILMLTAMGEETDRIIGLEVGADDYLGKPFNPRELVARINAILRRTSASTVLTESKEQEELSFADWTLNIRSRRLFSSDGVEVSLSTGEYDLLLTFIQRPQEVLSREELLETSKNRSLAPFDRSIDVQISRLRQKVEPNPKKPTLIKTVRGGGYIFTASVSKDD